MVAVNPRYAAFVAAHGKRPNHVFIDFIQFMLGVYAESEGGSHTPLHPYHLDDGGRFRFTLFIQGNAHIYRRPH